MTKMHAAVDIYRIPLTRPNKGKHLRALMSTRFVAAQAVTAVQESVKAANEENLAALQAQTTEIVDGVADKLQAQTTEIVDGVGEKLEDYMNGTMERPEDMDDVQWRNRCLTIARVAQGQANSAKQRIDAEKSAQWWMKKYPDEAERNKQLKMKRKLAEELQTEKANRLETEAVAKAKARVAAAQVMESTPAITEAEAAALS